MSAAEWNLLAARNAPLESHLYHENLHISRLRRCPTVCPAYSRYRSDGVSANLAGATGVEINHGR